LLSLSTLHASLSTSLALEYEKAQNKALGSGGLWYSSYNHSPLIIYEVVLNTSFNAKGVYTVHFTLM
jgi:hypothetical protein